MVKLQENQGQEAKAKTQFRVKKMKEFHEPITGQIFIQEKRLYL